MKLSAWAKKKGICYQTAYNWFRDGRLPVSAHQLPTGTILVEEPSPSEHSRVAIYARVSGHDQRKELDAQVGRCLTFANQQGLAVSESVVKVGSGLNGHRRQLLKLLSNPHINTIIVEHRDRLMRFGAEYVEAALASRGGQLLVVNSEELTEDLVSDMIEQKRPASYDYIATAISR